MHKRFKFAKGIAWFFLMLFMLLLVYTYYRAEIIFQGDLGAKYSKYYLTSITGITF